MFTVLFFVACSACILLTPRTTSPGVAPPTGSWALLQQLSTKRMFHGCAYRLTWYRHCLTWGLLFQNDSGLYQVDIKPSRTRTMEGWESFCLCLNWMFHAEKKLENPAWETTRGSSSGTWKESLRPGQGCSILESGSLLCSGCDASCWCFSRTLKHL